MDIAPSNSGFHPAGLILRQAVDRTPEKDPHPGIKPENNQDFSTQPVTQPELREIQQLAKRDREVRAHEQAHSSVGGPYAGSPSFPCEYWESGVNYPYFLEGGKHPANSRDFDKHTR